VCLSCGCAVYGGERRGAGGKGCGLLLCTQPSESNAPRLPQTQRTARGERMGGRTPVAKAWHGGWQRRVAKVAGAKAAGAARASLFRSCSRSHLLLLVSLSLAPVGACGVRCCSRSDSGVSCRLVLSLSLAPLPLPLTCSTYTHRVTSMNPGLIHLDHTYSFM